MKFRVLGSLFLSSSLLLAACGNSGDDDSGKKTEKKEETKSASQVISDLQDNAKDVNSYHTDNAIAMKPKDGES
ncbi:hypothetical protein L1F34_001052 [Mammaliicoccus lentus]